MEQQVESKEQVKQPSPEVKQPESKVLEQAPEEESKSECQDAKELADFISSREKEVILINNLVEDDAIADCLQVAESTEQKHAMMRYRRLKQHGLMHNPAGTTAIL